MAVAGGRAEGATWASVRSGSVEVLLISQERRHPAVISRERRGPSSRKSARLCAARRTAYASMRMAAQGTPTPPSWRAQASTDPGASHLSEQGRRNG